MTSEKNSRVTGLPAKGAVKQAGRSGGMQQGNQRAARRGSISVLALGEPMELAANRIIHNENGIDCASLRPSEKTLKSVAQILKASAQGSACLENNGSASWKKFELR